MFWSYQKISSVLRVLADQRRLRIMNALMWKELCVCELVEVLVLPQYEVSRLLALLKKAGLVEYRRDGRWAYYSIADSIRREPFLAELLKLLQQSVATRGETARDFRRLERRLALRVGGCCTIGLRS
jgi:ArsR family transcriptional regulator